MVNQYRLLRLLLRIWDLFGPSCVSWDTKVEWELDDCVALRLVGPAEIKEFGPATGPARCNSGSPGGCNYCDLNWLLFLLVCSSSSLSSSQQLSRLSQISPQRPTSKGSISHQRRGDPCCLLHIHAEYLPKLLHFFPLFPILS